MKYSNIEKNLHEILLGLKLSDSQNNGIRFEMTDHVFDNDFDKKIKN